MHTRKAWLGVIGVLVVIAVGVAAKQVFYQKRFPPVSNFDECAAAGYPIAESYPEQCRTPDGKLFIRDIGNELELTDRIIATNPRPNQVIQSPLMVEGEARGTWYFEASFPVKLVDANGYVLAQRPAQAQSDWMTESFVPFRLELSFAKPSTPTGTLILEKDNPSGLPQNDAALRIPVRFQPAEPALGTTRLNVFFADARSINEEPFDCSKTVALPRVVPNSAPPEELALEALFRGETDEEREDDVRLITNRGVTIQSLAITDGVARVDLNDALLWQLGGACQVTAVRAEITDTLKQFPTITNVIISVNGETDGVLEP